MTSPSLHLVHDVAHRLLWLAVLDAALARTLNLDTLHHLSASLLDAGASSWAPIPAEELPLKMHALYCCDIASISDSARVESSALAHRLSSLEGAPSVAHCSAASALNPWFTEAPLWKAWRRAFRAEAGHSRETEELEQALAQAAWLYERERDEGVQLRAQLLEAEAQLRHQAWQVVKLTRLSDELSDTANRLTEALQTGNARMGESPFRTLARASDLPPDTGARPARIH